MTYSFVRRDVIVYAVYRDAVAGPDGEYVYRYPYILRYCICVYVHIYILTCIEMDMYVCVYKHTCGKCIDVYNLIFFNISVYV